MKLRNALFLLCMGTVISLMAEIKETNGIFWDAGDPTEGVRVLPCSESTWRSGDMSTEPFPLKNLKWTARDYFLSEYGVPCDFAGENIMRRITGAVDTAYRIENGRLCFETGTKGAGFMLGARPQQESIPPIRIGSTFERHLFEHLFLEIVVDNGNSEETEWQYNRFYMRSFHYDPMKPFKIKGKGVQRHFLDLGYMRNITGSIYGGIKLTCLTKNITAKLLSLKMATRSADVSWRYEFELPFQPERSLATLELANVFELYVNGEKIAEGNRLPKNIKRTIDLSPYLKKGKNVIAVWNRFMGSYGVSERPAVFCIEGIAVASDGRIFRILTGPQWRYTFLDPGKEWLKSGFDTSGWKIPKVGRPADKYHVTTLHRKQHGFTGVNPAHMGILDVKPATQKYPVFDAGNPVVYAVNLPGAMKGLTGNLKIVDAETNTVLKNLSFSEKDKTLELDIRKAGAYRLFWNLKQKGKELDACKGELIIAGPLELKEVPFLDFESELKKSLQLVETIDFTRGDFSKTDFIDFRRNALTGNEKSVVSKNGMTYRETGKAQGDSFSVRFHKLELGIPYLIEVVVPDNQDRYILARVIESYLAPFQNNPPDGKAGFPASSGASMVGGDFPLSGRTKTIRFLHVPGTTRGTLTIQNGAGDWLKTPAAAIRADIYRFRKGVPALKLPETTRLYGQHSERYLFNRWAAAENIAEANISFGYNGHADAWINNWKAVKTYISLMKFRGENTTMQGTYMYRFGVPMDKYCEQSGNDEFDLHFLFAKMFRQNKINHYMTFEFQHPQFLYMEKEMNMASDRKIWRKEGRSIYSVDKYGNQVVGHTGINPLSRQFQKAYRTMLRDIYRRYDGLGIKGLYVVTGFWWSPAISTSTYYHLLPSDISFDDETVEQFEQDTGIRLHADEPGRERFMKRHTLLTGKYQKQWNDWRVKKMHQFWKAISRDLSSGRDHWQILVYTQIAQTKTDDPFLMASGTFEQRAGFLARRMEEMGYRETLYQDKNLRIVPPLISQTYSAISNLPRWTGLNRNKATMDIVRRQNAAFMVGTNLHEQGTARYGNQPWWWKQNVFTGSVNRPAREYAFVKEIMASRVHAPQIMVDNWMDNQPVFSHDDECRRFLQAFYATPDREYRQSERISGIDALIAGDCLKLINASTHEVRGRLKFPGGFHEMVWDNKYKGSAEFTMKPMDQLVFRVKGSAEAFTGEFRFASGVEKKILRTAADLLCVNVIQDKVHPSVWTALKIQHEKKDAYRTKQLLDDFEIHFYAKAFCDAGETMKVQHELESLLAKTGTARINVAGGRITDRKGCVWLPDQKYTGYNAYGNEFANIANRNPEYPVTGTDYPEVFFTEAYGSAVFYTIPLPEGEYKIELLSAETYPPNKVRGRVFRAAVNGRWKVFDIYKLCPGFLREAKQVWTVKASSINPVRIELKGEVGLNGIIIRKEGK